MVQFVATPIPDASALKDIGSLHATLRNIAENVEILTGQRGTAGRAVLNETIGIDPSKDWTVLKQIKAPSGFVTSAVGGVPTYTDFVNLANDVQQLVADVATIQRVLQLLITNMRR